MSGSFPSCTAALTSSTQAVCASASSSGEAGPCPWPCAFDPKQFQLQINGTVLPGPGTTDPASPGLTFAGIQNQVPYSNVRANVQLNDIFTIVQNFRHASNNDNIVPWAGILLQGDQPNMYLPIVCNTASALQKGTGAPAPMLFTVCRNPGPVDSLLILPMNQQLAAVAPLMQCATDSSGSAAQYMAFVSGAGGSKPSAAPSNLRHGFAVCNSYSPPHVYILYSDIAVPTSGVTATTINTAAIQTNSIQNDGAYWSVFASPGTGFVTQDSTKPTSCACVLPADSASSQCIQNTDDKFEWAYAAQLNLQFSAQFIQINQLTFVDKSVSPAVRWNGQLQYVSAWGCECGPASAPSADQCYTGSTGSSYPQPNTGSTCFTSSCVVPCTATPVSLAPHREFTNLKFGESMQCYQALYGETYATVTWAPATAADADVATARGQMPYTLTYCAPARFYAVPGISLLMSLEQDPILKTNRKMFLDVRNTNSGGSNIYFWTVGKPGGTSSEANPPENTLSKEKGIFGRDGSGKMSIWGIIGIALLVVVGIIIIIIIIGIVLRFRTPIEVAKAMARTAPAPVTAPKITTVPTIVTPVTAKPVTAPKIAMVPAIVAPVIAKPTKPVAAPKIAMAPAIVKPVTVTAPAAAKPITTTPEVANLATASVATGGGRVNLFQRRRRSRY